MIEILEGFPNNTVGIKASGNVSKEDYQNVLIPALKAALEKKEKIRILYYLGEDFDHMDPGAMWEDFSFGVGHFTSWEKIAVVTDVPWIKKTMGALGFIMPCPMKVFNNTELDSAKTWISTE